MAPQSSAAPRNWLKSIFTLPAEKRVFGLDLMRALAILAVLMTHAQLVLPGEELAWIGTYAGVSGALGVELFFVLSGFLIGSILLSLEPRFSTARTLPYFWQRRWLRTIPNYLLFLLINIAAAALVSRAIPNLLLYVTFTQNWLWPHPAFFDQAWSLTIEEWFYLLFPISLFLLYRLLKSFDAAFVISTGIFLVVPTVIRINWASAASLDWDEYFRKVMWLRLDAIMYGVLAAWLKKRSPRAWVDGRGLLAVAGGLIVVASWSLFVGHQIHSDFFIKTFLFSVTSLGFACLLPVCDQWQNGRESLLTRAVRLIALWSYSLYLCNLLVAQVFMFINERLPDMSFALGIVFFVSFFAINFGISGAVYTFFEKPFLDLRNRFTDS